MVDSNEFSEPETIECCTCGHIWIKGHYGGHNCVTKLQERIQELDYDASATQQQLDLVTAENKRLKDNEKKHLSMIENGLGFEDLERGIGDI
jgi:hypothetical protein